MTRPVLTFFNNKSGVGKTMLAYHIAWMLSELGKTVVVVDLDPQANLTASFLEDERVGQLWDHGHTVYGSLAPLFEGEGGIADPHIEDITRRLALDNFMAFAPDALTPLGGYPGGEDKAREFVKAIYANVPVLDTGARGATVTFVERGVGDVLLAWENEAFLAQREFGKDKFEIVSPPLSILAEPPLSVVDAVADKKGTRAVAEAYLKYWYSREGQEIAARNSYRPRDSEIAKEYEKSFAKVELFTIDDVFGGWAKAQKEHFAEGGIFDQIYKN